jgi:hypothetical protein
VRGDHWLGAPSVQEKGGLFPTFTAYVVRATQDRAISSLKAERLLLCPTLNTLAAWALSETLVCCRYLLLLFSGGPVLTHSRRHFPLLRGAKL